MENKADNSSPAVSPLTIRMNGSGESAGETSPPESIPKKECSDRASVTRDQGGTCAAQDIRSGVTDVQGTGVQWLGRKLRDGEGVDVRSFKSRADAEAHVARILANARIWFTSDEEAGRWEVASRRVISDRWALESDLSGVPEWREGMRVRDDVSGQLGTVRAPYVGADVNAHVRAGGKALGGVVFVEFDRGGERRWCDANLLSEAPEWREGMRVKDEVTGEIGTVCAPEMGHPVASPDGSVVHVAFGSAGFAGRVRWCDAHLLSEVPPAEPAGAFVCEDCGPTAVDEDGCCSTCGRDAAEWKVGDRVERAKQRGYRGPGTIDEIDVHGMQARVSWPNGFAEWVALAELVEVPPELPTAMTEGPNEAEREVLDKRFPGLRGGLMAARLYEQTRGPAKEPEPTELKRWRVKFAGVAIDVCVEATNERDAVLRACAENTGLVHVEQARAGLLGEPLKPGDLVWVLPGGFVAPQYARVLESKDERAWITGSRIALRFALESDGSRVWLERDRVRFVQREPTEPARAPYEPPAVTHSSDVVLPAAALRALESLRRAEQQLSIAYEMVIAAERSELAAIGLMAVREGTDRLRARLERLALDCAEPDSADSIQTASCEQFVTRGSHGVPDRMRCLERRGSFAAFELPDVPELGPIWFDLETETALLIERDCRLVSMEPSR